MRTPYEYGSVMTKNKNTRFNHVLRQGRDKPSTVLSCYRSITVLLRKASATIGSSAKFANQSTIGPSAKFVNGEFGCWEGTGDLG